MRLKKNKIVICVIVSLFTTAIGFIFLRGFFLSDSDIIYTFYADEPFVLEDVFQTRDKLPVMGFKVTNMGTKIIIKLPAPAYSYVDRFTDSTSYTFVFKSNSKKEFIFEDPTVSSAFKEMEVEISFMRNEIISTKLLNTGTAFVLPPRQPN